MWLVLRKWRGPCGITNRYDGVVWYGAPMDVFVCCLVWQDLVWGIVDSVRVRTAYCKMHFLFISLESWRWSVRAVLGAYLTNPLTTATLEKLATAIGITTEQLQD